MSISNVETPRGNAAGFVRYFKEDLVSGLMVFIIALPLCLAISLASGYPAMAGIMTAVIGSILTTFISNSELTIKGPAAGLIVIVLGCIKDFGGNGFSDGQGPGDFDAYRACLAVGVATAVLQILFGLFRAGILSEFFPKSAIHGMLSAIGVIIIAKQIPNALGVSTDKQEPLELLAEIPHLISEANPAIASIGLLSLCLLGLWPTIKKKIQAISAIPPQLVVLVVAVLIGLYLNLLENHQYKLFGHEYKLGDQYLVPLPSKMFGILDQITLPDFGVLKQWIAWKWIGMFFIIGTLESILSAKAIDSIDPWKRKTDMNRDVLAVGCANLCASMFGGLPMISEIVRSKANIDNGARTRLVQRKNLIIDVSDAKLIDHTVMEKLHETQSEFTAEGLKLEIVGLEQHRALSNHAEAARKRGLARLRRITIVAEPDCEELLQRECLARGASGFTVTPSRGVGRHNVHDGTWETTNGIRLETIVPFQVSEGFLKYLREEVMTKYHATVSVETIEVLLPDQFSQSEVSAGPLANHG